MRSRHCNYIDPYESPIYYLGLDLGQRRDYTALSVVQRNPGIMPEYHIRGLKRFPLGTSYPDIVKQVKHATEHRDVQPSLLLVDNTGVGTAVSDLLRDADMYFGAITITGGDTYHKSGRNFSVPKRDLASALQVLLQTDRLKIPSQLPESNTLVEELLNFQVRISASGHDTYGSWREGIHDDLVLSVSMACWAAEMKYLPLGVRWPSTRSSDKGGSSRTTTNYRLRQRYGHRVSLRLRQL